MGAFIMWKFLVVICAILGPGYAQTLDGTCPEKRYCVTVPKECVGKTCKAVVIVEKKPDNTFSFEGKLGPAAEEEYIGVGLSKDDSIMGNNDFIVVCFNLNGTQTGTFNAVDKVPLVPIAPIPSEVQGLTATLDAAVLVCKFALKFPLTVAGTPIDFKPKNQLFVLLAHGGLGADGSPQNHGTGKTAGDKDIWMDETYTGPNTPSPGGTTEGGNMGGGSTTEIPPDSSNYLSITGFLLILAFAHIAFVTYRHF